MPTLLAPRRAIKPTRRITLKAAPRRWCATPRCEGWAEPNHRYCPGCEAAEGAREALERLIRSGDVRLIRTAAELIEQVEVDAVLWTTPAFRSVIDLGIDSAGRMWRWSGRSAEAVRQVRDPVIDREETDDFWGLSAEARERAELDSYLAREL